jgi:hypothetical protein
MKQTGGNLLLLENESRRSSKRNRDEKDAG